MKSIFGLMQAQASQTPKSPVSENTEDISVAENPDVTQSDAMHDSANISLPASESQTEVPQSTPIENNVQIETVSQQPSSSPQIILQRQQPQPNQQNSSSTGFLIFIFSAIFFALLCRRLTSMQ